MTTASPLTLPAISPASRDLATPPATSADIARIPQAWRRTLMALKQKSQSQAYLPGNVRRPVDFVCSYTPVFRGKHQVRPRAENVVSKHHLVARWNQWRRVTGAKRLPERCRIAPAGSRRNIELMLRVPPELELRPTPDHSDVGQQRGDNLGVQQRVLQWIWIFRQPAKSIYTASGEKLSAQLRPRQQPQPPVCRCSPARHPITAKIFLGRRQAAHAER